MGVEEKENPEREREKAKLRDLIAKQLNPRDYTPLNPHEIQNYVYYGYSDQDLRPKYWKMFLKYFSTNKFQTESFYKQARQSYHDILEKTAVEDEKLLAFKKTICSELDRSALINKTPMIISYKIPIERILTVFTIINPCIGYVQGMINLAYIFYHVLAQEKDIEDAKFAEEDAFYLFNSLISEMSNLFIGEFDDQKNGLKNRMNEVFTIVREKDPELYRVLIEKELDKSMFPMRWILLLFSAEYDAEDVIWLWDKILSDSYRFEIVLYCSAAVIILMRDIIFKEDFERCMIVLQNPKSIPPKLLFHVADLMRRSKQDINKLIKEMSSK